MYLAAAGYLPYSLERVEIPFPGRAGEGSCVIGYLVRPRNAGRMPLVILWAGIDTFKEDRAEIADPVIAANLSLLLIDMPGTGEAPPKGSEDAERLWDAVLTWCAKQLLIDAARIGAWGGSTVGYWAAKIAHTHRDKLAAVVVQGGCVHYAFMAEWTEKVQHGSYAFELAETLASSFARASFEGWLEYCPCLSLLKQGVSTGLRRRFCSSRAPRTRSFQSRICACCWNTAARKRRGSIQSVVWATRPIRSR